MLHGPTLLVITLLAPLTRALSVPRIFGDGMVLQASPLRAQIWGNLDGVTEGDVSVTLRCASLTKNYLASKENDLWSVILDPVTEGEICNVQITQEGQPDVVLSDVLFGDVWVCSGQSNMEWPMSGIFNADEEIATIATYENIRLYRTSHATSSKPEPDFVLPSTPDFWTKVSSKEYTSSFSAVCLLYAKEVSDRIGSKAFGLIETNWGGTRVEPWSTPEGLSTCGVPPFEDPSNPATSNSFLYNAMIHPIIKMTIKGALWYQGESNSDWNQDLYNCTFPQLISEWRRMWSENSPTDANFPFGFVQLAAWREGLTDYGFPVIRWHQTADIGYVPNDVMRNVFMAVSLDTYDAESGIHPRNKQLPSKRLALSGLNVAYEQSEYPTNGPLPSGFQFVDMGQVILAEITFNEPLIVEVKEGTGFYTCCSTNYNDCDINQSWTEVSEFLYDSALNSVVMEIESCATGLAYLWKETPVLGTEALPIYADNEFRLPAAPWKHPVVFA